MSNCLYTDLSNKKYLYIHRINNSKDQVKNSVVYMYIHE